MKPETTGTLITRAAGLVLILMGASPLLYLIPWFQPPGMATSGWTGYSPTAATIPNQDVLSRLHDTYYVISGTFSFYLPSLAQALAGVALILMSRPVGRWLAKGLNGQDANGTG